MIIERFFAVFWGTILLIIFLILSFIFKKPLGRKILFSCFIVYISAVVSITIFPIFVEPELMVMTDKTFNFIPFSTISELLFNNSSEETVFLQVAGNIIMCIPYGVALPLMIKRKKWFYYILYALAFPVAIELTQLIISISANSFYRTIDIDDVILNFIGVMLGYAIYKILPKFMKDFFGFNPITKDCRIPK